MQCWPFGPRRTGGRRRERSRWGSPWCSSLRWRRNPDPWSAFSQASCKKVIWIMKLTIDFRFFVLICTINKTFRIEIELIRLPESESLESTLLHNFEESHWSQIAKSLYFTILISGVEVAVLTLNPLFSGVRVANFRNRVNSTVGAVWVLSKRIMSEVGAVITRHFASEERNHHHLGGRTPHKPQRGVHSEWKGNGKE